MILDELENVGMNHSTIRLIQSMSKQEHDCRSKRVKKYWLVSALAFWSEKNSVWEWRCNSEFLRISLRSLRWFRKPRWRSISYAAFAHVVRSVLESSRRFLHPTRIEPFGITQCLSVARMNNDGTAWPVIHGSPVHRTPHRIERFRFNNASSRLKSKLNIKN